MLNLQKQLDLISKELSVKDIDGIDYFARYVEMDAYDGCNLDCIMCPLGKSIYKGGGPIPQKLFKKIVDELAEYSDWIYQVCLSRNGEPLLNKNIASMIKQLKDVGIKRVNFSTNATALTEKKAHELLESGLDEIRFSIDGVTKETFEKVRQGVEYERVLKNCLKFIEIREKYKDAKTQVQIRFVEQKANSHEVQMWKNFWLTKVRKTDVVASKKMHSWSNELDGLKNKSTDPKFVSDRSNIHPCISPFSSLEILYDGTVPLCGSDYLRTVTFGNVYKNTLKEIWNSKEFKKVRDLHKSGNRNQIDACIGCKIWDKDIKTVHYNK